MDGNAEWAHLPFSVFCLSLPAARLHKALKGLLGKHEVEYQNIFFFSFSGPPPLHMAAIVDDSGLQNVEKRAAADAQDARQEDTPKKSACRTRSRGEYM